MNDNGSQLDDGTSSVDSSQFCLLEARIQAELESLNAAADSVNKLENELQAAQVRYIRDRQSFIKRLEVLHKKIGSKFIMQAAKYYELSLQSQKVQIDARRSAEKFQRAGASRDRARDSLKLIELSHSTAAVGKLDDDKLEALNKATEEFMNAEKEKAQCESEHQSKAMEFTAMQQYTAFLLKDAAKAIRRAKPFYDLKEQLENVLQVLRQSAEDLALALRCSKDRYRMALDALESISDEVHEQRRLMLTLPPRTPGVGAETTDELASWPSTSIDVCVTLSDQASLSSDSPQTQTQTQNAAARASTVVAVGALSGRFEGLSAAEDSVDADKTPGRLMECIHRDSSGDGAEDSSAANLAEVPARSSSGSEKVPTDSLSQRSMTVSTLPSGIYIAKSVANDQLAVGENNSHQIVRQQFPLLQNLRDTGSQGKQRLN